MTNYRTKSPVLTVYMPVFNAASYVSDAIDSILTQTYKNFEFIIIDDCSTDCTPKILKSYSRRDPRIRLYRNKINLGVSASADIAISLARGKFLARMDADDISFPDRFQKQIRFLKNNPQTVAVGGQCITINSVNKIIGNKKFPTSPQAIQDMMFWAVPIQHPTLMVNLKMLPQNFVWYDRNKTSAEEINLMFRLLTIGKLANLPEFLIYYRQLPTSLSRINPKYTFYLTLLSRITAFKIGHKPTLKALFINIAQIGAVLILPTPAINQLWNLIRGINSNDTQFQIGTFAPVKV